jgi:hypothetical protein
MDMMFIADINVSSVYHNVSTGHIARGQELFLLYFVYCHIKNFRNTCYRPNLDLHFIYYLFNDVFNSSGYIASNIRFISEQWSRKDVDGSGRGLTLSRLSPG